MQSKQGPSSIHARVLVCVPTTMLIRHRPCMPRIHRPLLHATVHLRATYNRPLASSIHCRMHRERLVVTRFTFLCTQHVAMLVISLASQLNELNQKVPTKSTRRLEFHDNIDLVNYMLHVPSWSWVGTIGTCTQPNLGTNKLARLL